MVDVELSMDAREDTMAAVSAATTSLSDRPG